MGQLPPGQNALFYEFCLERHIPPDHLLRQIDTFLDLGHLRERRTDCYSTTGRPSIDPELMIRMLIGDTAFGAAPMLGWLVDEKSIAPHVPVWDKRQRKDAAFSVGDFIWRPESDTCQARQGNR